MRLKDKTIIVTGGTSGIGAAIARAIVREGGTVLVHGINQSEGEALVKALGASAHLCIADLRQESAPQTIVKACLGHFGILDGFNARNPNLPNRKTLMNNVHATC